MSAGHCGQCGGADTAALTADEVQCFACGGISRWRFVEAPATPAPEAVEPATAEESAE